MVFFLAGSIAIVIVCTAESWLHSIVATVLALFGMVCCLIGVCFVLPNVPSCPIGFPMIGFVLQGTAGLLLLATALLLSVATIPFAFDAWLLGAAFELSAEAAPPGIHRLLQLHAPALQGLMHSTAYQNEESLTEISNWIARQCDSNE
jgi:hypothetical protein